MENLKELTLKYKNDYINFLRDLIAIPSPSGHEKEIVGRIEKEMKRLKFDEIIIDKMGNIIGRLGKGKTKILYDSHIDTVGVGDPQAWPSDPFKGKLEKSIIFGRGASDNKAATVTQIYGAKIIKELGLNPNLTLYVLGTVQEEDCDGLAMQYVIEKTGIKPDYIVLGECTNLDIYRGHRGRMMIKVITQGKACHASAPSRGENAIYKMAPIIEEIKKLKFKDDPFLGEGTVAVSKIECQTGSLNTVPDQCSIYLDRRLTQGENKESALNEISSLPSFKEAKLEISKYFNPSYTGLVVEQEQYFPTWTLPEDHQLVQAGVKAAEKILDRKPKIDKWVFSTNGVASMGRLKIPTIGFGPSEERFAHSTNDQVSIDHLVKAVQFFALFPNILLEKI